MADLKAENRPHFCVSEVPKNLCAGFNTRTPLTHMMVWKSSSTRIMSAASLQTSVPVWPIATPMSAAFRATASFTPSPVMATTAPMFWRDCGETNTESVYGLF